MRWIIPRFVILSFILSACSSGGGELLDAGEEPVVEDGSDYDDDYDDDYDQDHENENGGDEDPGSLCMASIEEVSCPHHTSTLETGTTGLITRDVHWMVPYGNPPAGGWPVVLMFQGSAFNPEHNWKGTKDDLYGPITRCWC